MKKYDLACAIEAHHLYQPILCNSKRYYHYNEGAEIRELMKRTKAELTDLYDLLYGYDGRELSAHEINY